MAVVVAAVPAVRLASPSRDVVGAAAAAVNSSTDRSACVRDRVTLIAHRGSGNGTRTIAGRVYSENTVPAFRAAFDHGADGVEADYWPTSDGRIVVHHDETLDRMTNGHGPIGRQTWADVSRLRHPSGARIPSFEVLTRELKRMPGQRQQELKEGYVFSDRQLRHMVRSDVAGAGDAYERVLYTSSGLTTLGRIHAIDERVRLGLITRSTSGRPALSRLPAWLDVVLIDLRAADAAYVRQASEGGYTVSLRGVDTVAQLHEAARLGAGRVMTNRPELLGRAC